MVKKIKLKSDFFILFNCFFWVLLLHHWQRRNLLKNSYFSFAFWALKDIFFCICILFFFLWNFLVIRKKGVMLSIFFSIIKRIINHYLFFWFDLKVFEKQAFCSTISIKYYDLFFIVIFCGWKICPLCSVKIMLFRLKLLRV